MRCVATGVGTPIAQRRNHRRNGKEPGDGEVVEAS